MERWLETADAYIKNMKICDVALLKICVCAAGVMLGMAIPRRNRKVAAFLTTGIFSLTYILVMVPFLKLLEKEKTV